jgi:hypothetical protein
LPYPEVFGSVQLDETRKTVIPVSPSMGKEEIARKLDVPLNFNALWPLLPATTVGWFAASD